MNVLDLGSLGFAMRSRSEDSAEWQNPSLPDFQSYLEAFPLKHYELLPPQAQKPLVGSDSDVLNGRLEELGGCADYEQLLGSVGVVTATDAHVTFAEGCGEFIVEHHDGDRRRFFTVAAPAAQIFDVPGPEGRREQITLVYTNDNGFLLLMASEALKDDLAMLQKIHWAMGEVGKITCEQGMGKPFGTESGASKEWQAVVFPALAGMWWRQIDWMVGANVSRPSTVRPIHSVHQRFSLAFDDVPAVEPPRVLNVTDPQIHLLNRPFVMAKAVPTHTDAGKFPYHIAWALQAEMADWERV